MAHFAELDENNIVLRVIVVDNSVLTVDGVENEMLGIEFIKNLLGSDTNWVQTSYNNSFRRKFAGIGYIYNHEYNIFIEPKPYESWVFDYIKLEWASPVDYPTDGFNYFWDESILNWVKI